MIMKKLGREGMRELACALVVTMVLSMMPVTSVRAEDAGGSTATGTTSGQVTSGETATGSSPTATTDPSKTTAPTGTPTGTATPAPGGTATPAPGGTATPAPGGTATPAPSGTATTEPGGTATTAPTTSGSDPTTSGSDPTTSGSNPTPTPAPVATPTPAPVATPTPAPTQAPIVPPAVSVEAATNASNTVGSAVQGALNSIKEATGVEIQPEMTVDAMQQKFEEAFTDDASGNEKKAAVVAAVTDALKGQNQDTLEKAMLKTDGALLKQVEALEKALKKQAKAAAKDAEVTKFVDTSKINVVGAGLNAVSGGDAPELTMQSSPAKVPAEYEKRVTNQVAINIDLTGVVFGEDKTLAIPVSITMPIPAGINPSKLVIIHETELLRNVMVTGVNVTFTVTHFSNFFFAEAEESSADTSSGASTSSGGGCGTGAPSIEEQVGIRIALAKEGETVTLKGVQSLSNSIMKALLKRKDVTLVMEYTYKEKEYIVRIPAGEAVDDDIPVYGPLYLAGRYGNEADPAWKAAQAEKAAAEAAAAAAEKAALEAAAKAAAEAERAALEEAAKKAPETEKAAKASVYVVQRGDTMSAIAKANNMTLKELAAKNPQIKNLNQIRVGQEINL